MLFRSSLGSCGRAWLRLWCCEGLLTWDIPCPDFHGPALARAEQHLHACKLHGARAARVGRAAGSALVLSARIAAGDVRACTDAFGRALLGIDALGKVFRRRLRSARRCARQLLVGSLLAPVPCGGIVMLAALACAVLVRLAAARRSTPGSALDTPGWCALLFAVLVAPCAGATSVPSDITCSRDGPSAVLWTLSCTDGTSLSGGAPYASSEIGRGHV